MPEAKTEHAAAVDRLYALPPKEFVAARNRLAERLRPQDRDAADEVQALIRPTKAAWALNVVARAAPDDVVALRAAGEAVREAQQRAVSGAHDGSLRAADERRDEIISRLADAAVAHAGTGHREAIQATLEAASVDPDVGDRLAAGRLSKPAPLPTGLGDLASMLESSTAPRRTKAPTGSKVGGLRRDLQRVEREISRETDTLDRAHADLERLRATIETAEARRGEHIRRRDALREDLDAATRAEPD